MKKSELIERVAKAHTGLVRAEAEAVVNIIFQSIAEALARGERVELRGLGVFTAKARRPRRARNPKTGEEVLVPARRVPHFRPSKELLKRVNGKGER